MSSEKIKLTDEEIEDFRQSFSLFDSDADGQLSGDEIEKMFQVAGLNPTKKELENIMTTGDKNENRSIDFNEFLELMESCNLPRDPKEREVELTAAFNKFDTNGDGFIDREEFRKIMKHGGETTEEIDKLMDEYDVNKDGKLEYKEFVILWAAS